MAVAGTTTDDGVVGDTRKWRAIRAIHNNPYYMLGEVLQWLEPLEDGHDVRAIVYWGENRYGAVIGAFAPGIKPFDFGYLAPTECVTDNMIREIRRLRTESEKKGIEYWKTANGSIVA